MGPFVNMGVSMPADTKDHIDARRGETPLSTHLATDLATLWAILDIGLREARALFNKNEASLILSAQRDVIVNPESLSAWVYSEFVRRIEESCTLDGLAEKWKCDSDALLKKLRQASPLAIVALLDWTTTFWRTHNTSGVSFDAAVSGFVGTKMD